MSTEGRDSKKHRNAVSLAGRISSAPVERELPSGDRVVTFRLVLDREQTPMTAKSKQVSDWVDCSAWPRRLRGRVSSWAVDDQVELEGALRRRFFRSGTGATSIVEIEVLRGRRLGRGR